jgi:hypothetical protein
MGGKIVTTALDWMISSQKRSPKHWPHEFPSESDSQFWQTVARLEMTHRVSTSEKIQRLIEGSLEPASMSALELWFLTRRCEFAAQIALASAQSNNLPPDDLDLSTYLHWLLIDAWHSDGCIGFWNHAIERGGKPHPENPDGFSPLESSS